MVTSVTITEHLGCKSEKRFAECILVLVRILTPKLSFAFKHFDRSAVEFGVYYVVVVFL